MQGSPELRTRMRALGIEPHAARPIATVRRLSSVGPFAALLPAAAARAAGSQRSGLVTSSGAAADDVKMPTRSRAAGSVVHAQRRSISGLLRLRMALSSPPCGDVGDILHAWPLGAAALLSDC